ncbi:MAG: hypothetical protein KC583_14790, partial [Myxococcales bacterium]|nr:hypothetical protein [Myxococcales bacterium]
GINFVEADGAGPTPIALLADGAATLVEVERVSLAGVKGHGLQIRGGAALVGRHLAMSVIGHATATANALEVHSGGHAEVDAVTIETVYGVAVAASGDSTHVTVGRLLVDEVVAAHADEGGEPLEALVADDRAQLTVHGARIGAYAGSAVRVGEGAHFELANATIGRAAVENTNGFGVRASRAARVELRSVAFVGFEAGGAVFERTDHVSMTDVTIKDPRPFDGVANHDSVGVGLYEVGEAELERVAVVRAHRIGVEAVRSSVRARDLEVVRASAAVGSGVLPATPDSAALGVGFASTDSDVEVDRLRVSLSQFAGVWVANANTQPSRLVARDLEVSEGVVQVCKVAGCDDRGGHGLFLEAGVDVAIERAVIHDNGGIGLWRDCGASVRLSETVIQRGQVGMAAPSTCEPLGDTLGACLSFNEADLASVTIDPPSQPD